METETTNPVGTLIPEELKNHLVNIQKTSQTFPSEDEAAKREREEKERKARAIEQRLLDSANLPARQSRVSPESVTMHPHQSSFYNSLKKKLKTGFIFAMIGNRGSGKSQMAVWLAQHACKTGVSAKYTTAIEFFMDIRECYNREEGPSEADIIAKFCNVGLLILDEIQERGNSSWEDRLLVHVIDRRYQNVKDTIIISNEAPEAFAKSMGASIVDRIRETGEILECTWPSFRRQIQQKAA